MMPSGRGSRMAMIQLSTPITIPSKMKILCTAPGQSEGERGRQESRQMRFRGYGVCVATEDEEVGWIW